MRTAAASSACALQQFCLFASHQAANELWQRRTALSLALSHPMTKHLSVAYVTRRSSIQLNHTSLSQANGHSGPQQPHNTGLCISAATVPCISQLRFPHNSAAEGSYVACAVPQNQPAACMHHDDSVSIQLQLTSTCRMIDRLTESEQSTDGCDIISVAAGVNRSSSTPRSALPKHIGILSEMTKPSRDCPAPAADRIGAGRLTGWSQQMPDDDGGAAMQRRHSTQSPPSSQNDWETCRHQETESKKPRVRTPSMLRRSSAANWHLPMCFDCLPAPNRDRCTCR